MAHIITETMDTILSIPTARTYIANFDKIEKFFKKSTLEEVLKNFKIRDFATFEYIPKEATGTYNHYINLGYVLITPKPVSAPYKEYATFKGKVWETTNYRLCYEFIVRDNYQTREKDLIRMALEIEYPYLKNFAYSMYRLDRSEADNELYLCVDETHVGNNYLGNKSIYVPLKALKEKNPQIAIDRHTSYFKDYYRGADREVYLKASLALLETPVAKQFFECVENNY